jgi:hypothetical protein
MERSDACLPATSSSDPPCIFVLKLTDYYSSTGFGLLLVEAAAVIATFFRSLEDLVQALLFRYTARLICSLGDAEDQNKTVILTNKQ